MQGGSSGVFSAAIRIIFWRWCELSFVFGRARLASSDFFYAAFFSQVLLHVFVRGFLYFLDVSHPFLRGLAEPVKHSDRQAYARCWHERQALPSCSKQGVAISVSSGKCQVSA